ncbi:MAG: glycosyltransferase family 2 protein [Cytophagales bacterium]|nr:MAG: glycosyltransferase family 2 protein [Cytophagales bacterium]TAF61334.1 MAG: glycosyltransferase family 2 protein [Cytophagales bacterium]
MQNQLDPPFFSVIVPTYNRAERLKKTIESILAQDFSNFELLVVDDGSTDHTPQTIQALQHLDKRIVYLPKKNEERSVARNYGLKHAKGIYTVFFDSDDFMHANHLACFWKAIKANPDTRFFTTKFQISDGKHVQASHIATWPEAHYGWEKLLEGNWYGTLLCIKREGKPLVPFPREFNICEDWIFNLINLQESPIFVIDQVTITVNDSLERSMAQHQKVIDAKLRATVFLEKTLTLNDIQKKTLWQNAYKLCMVHAYLLNDRPQALKYWKKVKSYTGLSKSLLISLLKLLIGKKNIDRLKV